MLIRVPNGDLVPLKGILNMVSINGFVEITWRRVGGIQVIPGPPPEKSRFESSLNQDEIDEIWNELGSLPSVKIISWNNVIKDILE